MPKKKPEAEGHALINKSGQAPSTAKAEQSEADDYVDDTGVCCQVFRKCSCLPKCKCFRTIALSCGYIKSALFVVLIIYGLATYYICSARFWFIKWIWVGGIIYPSKQVLIYLPYYSEKFKKFTKSHGRLTATVRNVFYIMLFIWHIFGCVRLSVSSGLYDSEATNTKFCKKSSRIILYFTILGSIYYAITIFLVFLVSFKRKKPEANAPDKV